MLEGLCCIEESKVVVVTSTHARVCLFLISFSDDTRVLDKKKTSMPI